MLQVIANERSRAVLAAVIETAEYALRTDGLYARELAGWAPRRAAPAATGYRTPPTRRAASAPSRTSPAGTSPMAAAGAPPGPARRRRFRSAGVVCLLTTAGDRPVDWVNAGQALQRVLLTGARLRCRRGAAQPAA